MTPEREQELYFAKAQMKLAFQMMNEVAMRVGVEKEFSESLKAMDEVDSVLFEKIMNGRLGLDEGEQCDV